MKLTMTEPRTIKDGSGAEPSKLRDFCFYFILSLASLFCLFLFSKVIILAFKA